MRLLLHLAILVFCVFTLPANGIVNVESMRVGTGQAGYSGNLDLTVSGKRGNTEQDLYGLAARLQHNRERITDFVVLSYDYGRVNGVVNTNKSFLHARHVVQYRPRRAWEMFMQMERNEFTRLSFRGLLGTGLRFILAEMPERRGLYLGTGAFWSRETLEARPGLTDEGSESSVRGSFYLAYKERLNEQVSFISTTYYQPRVNQPGDYRLLEQTALAVKMMENLSLKLSIDISHDSQPPQSIQQTDTSYKTIFSLSF